MVKLVINQCNYYDLVLFYFPFELMTYKLIIHNEKRDVVNWRLCERTSKMNYDSKHQSQSTYYKFYPIKSLFCNLWLGAVCFILVLSSVSVLWGCVGGSVMFSLFWLLSEEFSEFKGQNNWWASAMSWIVLVEIFNIILSKNDEALDVLQISITFPK